MKLTVRQPYMNQDGSVAIGNIKLEDIRIQNYAILSIDGSTTNSGLSIVREADGALITSISAEREKKVEEPVRYKIRLKRAVTDLLRRNKFIQTIVYEEPVVHHINAVANLYMLKSFIDEIIIENEPEFDYIKHYDVPNTRWKKEWLAPDKMKQKTEEQKKQIRDKFEQLFPFFKDITQDEIDAYAMGWATAKVGVENIRIKPKTRPFKFEVRFLGANTDDALESDLFEVYDGPSQLKERDIMFKEIDRRANFEKSIYDLMSDEDKIIIIKFSTKYHGNIMLQYEIGELAATYDYIYAVVWRRTRKN